MYYLIIVLITLVTSHAPCLAMQETVIPRRQAASLIMQQIAPLSLVTRSFQQRRLTTITSQSPQTTRSLILMRANQPRERAWPGTLSTERIQQRSLIIPGTATRNQLASISSARSLRLLHTISTLDRNNDVSSSNSSSQTDYAIRELNELFNTHRAEISNVIAQRQIEVELPWLPGYTITANPDYITAAEDLITDINTHQLNSVIDVSRIRIHTIPYSNSRILLCRISTDLDESETITSEQLTSLTLLRPVVNLGRSTTRNADGRIIILKIVPLKIYPYITRCGDKQVVLHAQDVSKSKHQALAWYHFLLALSTNNLDKAADIKLRINKGHLMQHLLLGFCD